MFIENKYTKCYFNIIHRAQSRTLDQLIYIERHHIIPRSMGGSNDASNLVKLTGREHFICHLLLPKMTNGTNRKKMIYAIWMMCRSGRDRRSIYKVTARTYSSIKEVMRNNRTADDFTPEWREKISVSKKGKSTWNRGRSVPEEQKSRQSATRKSKNGTPGFNVRPSCRPEKAKAISDTQKGRKWVFFPATNKRKPIEPYEVGTYLINGWQLGQGERKKRIQKGISTGLRWIHNPLTNEVTAVKIGVVDELLSKGWQLGRKLLNHKG
jgi:hypothetical protein